MVVEKAALTLGGVPVEIGTTGTQMWVRLTSSLPATIHEAIVDAPVGRIIATGDAEADATPITAIVSGVRGDRIILDGRLLPLAPVPTGVDTTWRPKRYEDVERVIAEAGRA